MRSLFGPATLPLTDSDILSVLIVIVNIFVNPLDSSVIDSEIRIPRSFAMNSAFTMFTGVWRIGSRMPLSANIVMYFRCLPKSAAFPPYSISIDSIRPSTS